MSDFEKQKIKEFEEFMLEEYGKWKIGRIEAERFFSEALHQARLNALEEVERGLQDYKRFSCGACEQKISNLSHTQFCLFRSDVLEIIKTLK